MHQPRYTEYDRYADPEPRGGSLKVSAPHEIDDKGRFDEGGKRDPNQQRVQDQPRKAILTDEIGRRTWTGAGAA